MPTGLPLSSLYFCILYLFADADLSTSGYSREYVGVDVILSRAYFDDVVVLFQNDYPSVHLIRHCPKCLAELQRCVVGAYDEFLSAKIHIKLFDSVKDGE